MSNITLRNIFDKHQLLVIEYIDIVNKSKGIDEAWCIFLFRPPNLLLSFFPSLSVRCFSDYARYYLNSSIRSMGLNMRWYWEFYAIFVFRLDSSFCNIRSRAPLLFIRLNHNTQNMNFKFQLKMFVSVIYSIFSLQTM